MNEDEIETSEELQKLQKSPELPGKNQEIRRDEKGRFVSGISGNPAGKPKGLRSFTTKVKEALEKIAEGKEYTYEEALVKSVLKKAIIDQDPQIIKLIWNYLDGMPQQSIDMTTEDVSEISPEVKELAQKLIAERYKNL